MAARRVHDCGPKAYEQSSPNTTDPQKDNEKAPPVGAKNDINPEALTNQKVWEGDSLCHRAAYT